LKLLKALAAGAAGLLAAEEEAEVGLQAALDSIVQSERKDARSHGGGSHAALKVGGGLGGRRLLTAATNLDTGAGRARRTARTT
jgi:hypothetical protein